jgi:hypothetical protein
MIQLIETLAEISKVMNFQQAKSQVKIGAIKFFPRIESNQK